jgi:hypothetical protein
LSEAAERLPLSDWKPSLFLTIVFSSFGLVNASSWQVFVVFVLFGGALDFFKMRIGQRCPMSHAESNRDPGLWFILIQIGFSMVAILAFVVVRQILDAPPDVAGAIGTLAYELASPWVRLLRIQYIELTARGYDARAGEIALYFPIIFILFYLSLTVQTIQFHRYFQARNTSFKPVDHFLRVFRERPVLMTFTFPILVLAIIFLFYIITFAGIEWHERGGKWRWDLHRSDAVLINYIIVMPLAAGMLSFLQLCFRRALV